VSVGTSSLRSANGLTALSNNTAFLCKSGYTGDATWKGSIHKYSMYDKALSAGEVAYLFKEGAETKGVPTGLNVSSLSNVNARISEGQLLVDYTLSKGADASITICDLNGKLLIQKRITGKSGYNKQSLDTSFLSNGIYIVKIVSDEFSVSKKVSK